MTATATIANTDKNMLLLVAKLKAAPVLKVSASLKKFPITLMG